MKVKAGSVVLLLSILLAACGAPTTPTSIPTSPPSVPTTAPSVPTTAPSVLPTMAPSPLDPGTSPVTGQEAAVANSRQDLAERLGVELSAVILVTVEAVDWPDGCLGIQTPGIMCTTVITPGYRVILEVSGKQYEYHTNESGSVVRLATPLS